MLKFCLSQSPTSPLTWQNNIFLAENIIKQGSMPVDYGSYLLAASPPGFDLHHTLRDHFTASVHCSKANPANSQGMGKASTSLLMRSVTSPADVGRESKHDGSLSTNAEGCEEEEITSLAEAIQFDLELGETVSPEHNINFSNNSSPANTSRRKMGKKSVSFADDQGKALVSIRFMTESSDTPPRLNPQLLSSLTQDASAGVTVAPPLILSFPQPASDYLAFREKIERNCVSLENVIVKDYNLIGTIKVKNLSFHKHVFVRCTFDNWVNHVDTAASFMMTGQTNSQFDTFSFELNVPPRMDVHNKVQFAICYETDGRQFWDNNGNVNYEVVPADWRSQEPAAPTDSDLTDWPCFAVWNNVDQSVPYY